MFSRAELIGLKSDLYLRGTPRRATMRARRSAPNVVDPRKLTRRTHMAERVSGPYRGYFISAAARLVVTYEAAEANAPDAIYVGSVSLSQRGPDDSHRI